MPRLRPLLSLFSLGLASLTTPTVVALSEYDALVTVKGFADALLAPNNVQVANSINRSVRCQLLIKVAPSVVGWCEDKSKTVLTDISTLFAEDVTGTVDLSTK